MDGSLLNSSAPSTERTNIGRDVDPLPIDLREQVNNIARSKRVPECIKQVIQAMAKEMSVHLENDASKSQLNDFRKNNTISVPVVVSHVSNDSAAKEGD
ncbi:unnamed protein product [Heligmosomoides polygyrus]|uniref:Uncharacterized protein n=1 Tax=Heligmosomoides polygyrus TaxID=6339 RepID=A0A183G6Q2_HELPZ|nr:unnamed protein product [Heligmosomoides polygyrus]